MPKKLPFTFFLLLLGVLAPRWGFAQESTLSGKVTTPNGEGLPGVSVLLKGTVTGTTTDVDGAYTLRLPERQGTLVFSSIGFTPQEVPIGNQGTIDVVLTEDTKSLGEVVVIGYGTQARRDITGAVSSIKADDVQNVPVASANALLQGRAAGVQVIQNSGAPGAGVTVRVRGTTSISASNEPLYVIDGVPVKSDDASGLGDNGTNRAASTLNPLADINPNDIESIDILKDAASAAIYGARAANGVVLITTKRGKAGAPSINFNYYTGVSDVIRRIPVLNASQYRDFLNEANINANRVPESFTMDSLNPYLSGDVFWQDEIFKPARTSNYDLSLRGGRENATYAFSAGYFDQEGVIIGTQFKRFTTRLNTEFAVLPKLKIGQNIAYTRSHSNRTSENDSPRSTLNFALVKAPIFPIYAPDGSFVPTDNINRPNPIAVAALAQQNAFTHRMIGNVYGQYDILPGLAFRTSVQMDLLALKEDRFFPNTIDQSENRQASSRSVTDLDWITEYTLNYTKTLADAHNVSVLGGFTQQENKREIVSIRAEGAPTNSVPTTNVSTLYREAATFETRWGISSFFGRLNYSFNDKYLFSFNVRRDASSRFGKDNRVGIFPSASAGWRLSGEPFMASLPFVSDLKLRTSLGVVGNQNGIGNYTAQGIYSAGANYNGAGGVAPTPTGIANPDLSWERTTQFDAGVDLSLFGNRVNFVADYYIKTTDDLLLEADVPRNSGYERIIRNVGSIENKGWEFGLNTTNVATGGFKWTTSGNIAFNRTKVLSLNSGEEELAAAGLSYSLTRVGLPVGTFYGWVAEGIYASDEENSAGLKNVNGQLFRGGDVIFKDLNEDGVINDLDRTVIGDPTPDFIGGLTNTFSFKGFDLSVFHQFSYGNDIYNAMRKRQNDVSGANNPTTAALARWRQPGDAATFPRAERGDPRVQNGRHSSRWVEDGSYFRFKTVTLGYSFPSPLLKKVFVKSLRVYVTGQNLLTFTDYSGFDPEVNSFASPLGFGVDNGVFPQTRTFVVGASLGF